MTTTREMIEITSPLLGELVSVGGQSYPTLLVKLLLGNAGVDGGDLSTTNALPAQTPFSKNIRVTPTITAGAYSSGQVVGGVISIANAVGATSLAGLLESMFITCKSNITPAFTIYFFDTNPSGGTYTDNMALTWNATDFTFLIGQYSTTAGDWKANNNKQTVDYRALGKVVVSTSTTIYALVVADGSFTPTSTSDLTFNFNIMQE